MILSEFINDIRSWTGITDATVHTDAMVTSWVRMGEERLNVDLRIDAMIDIDTSNVETGRVTVPGDWLMNDFIRNQDGREIKYMSRAEFYEMKQPRGYYTTSGRVMIIGGCDEEDNETVDVELHYFAKVPELGNGASTWLMDDHLGLITSAVLIYAFTHSEEYERASVAEANTSGLIAKLNDEYARRSAKGGTLIRKPSRRL